MDLLTAVKIVMRRWYVFLPTLALSVIVTASVVRAVPASYRARGSILITSPTPNGDPKDPTANPLQGIDYSSIVVTNIIGTIMRDPGVKTKLVQAGASPDYTVGSPSDGNTPVIILESVAPTPSAALNTVKILMEGVREELAQRQADAGAPPETWLRVLVLTSPTTADRLVEGKVRALAALALIGVTAALSLSFLVESISPGRRRARSSHGEELDGPPTSASGIGTSERTDGKPAPLVSSESALDHPRHHTPTAVPMPEGKTGVPVSEHERPEGGDDSGPDTAGPPEDREDHSSPDPASPPVSIHQPRSSPPGGGGNGSAQPIVADDGPRRLLHRQPRAENRRRGAGPGRGGTR